MRIVLMVAVVALAMGATGARAELSDGQRNVINGLGSAFAIEARCPTLKINPSVVGAAIMASGLDFRDPTTIATLASRVAAELYSVSERPEGVMCQTGLTLFGPNGQFPNTLIAAD